MNKLTSVIIAMLIAACGGIGDTTDPETHKVQKTTSHLPSGEALVEYTDLGFDWDLATGERALDLGDSEYGQVGQALAGVFIANRYGTHGGSGVSQSSNETRCPSGGVQSAPNWCEVSGTKDFFWKSSLDSSQDAAVGVNFQTAWTAARGKIKTGVAGGFTHTSVTSGQNATIAFGTCSAGYACTSIALGGIGRWDPSIGGNNGRYRQNIPLSDGMMARVVLTPAVMISSGAIGPGMTATQRQNIVTNYMTHEGGHTMNHGHQPSAEGANPMTGQNQSFQTGLLVFSQSQKDAQVSFNGFD